MRHLLTALDDSDLLFLLDTLSPTSDRARLMRVLREDEEILEGMLVDDRLLRRISDETQAHLRVSPRLLFAITLERIKDDLREQTYTVEWQAGHEAAVFDTPQVLRLIQDRAVRDYLVELLVSFVRIHSRTVTVKVRDGVWRRYRLNDFDVDSLIRHAETLSEDQRFPAYKRIADVCLFLLGVFPEHVGGGGPLGLAGRSRSTRRTWASYVSEGRRFYRAAADHTQARASGSAEVLRRLSDEFVVATKPLSAISARYLGMFKSMMFLP